MFTLHSPHTITAQNTATKYSCEAFLTAAYLRPSTLSKPHRASRPTHNTSHTTPMYSQLLPELRLIIPPPAYQSRSCLGKYLSIRPW
jgi:hypothetical protein